MGLADTFGNIVGNKSPDVNPIQYNRSQYGDQGYAQAQLQAQQGMQAGAGGLASAAGLYQSAATGGQPSVAQQQLVAGQQAAAMQANQMAASARGGAGAGIMAQRQAMDQQAAGAAGASQQSAMLRAHEMEQARAGLAGVSAQQQGLGQQYGIARQGQDIQERGLQLQGDQGTQGVQSANDLAAMKQNGGILGSLMGMAGGMAGAACCSPWTRIDTPQGERRVDALRVGDPVWSERDGHRVEARVAAIGQRRWDRGTHRVVKVRLENGRTLEVSGTHPTADGRTFDDLRAGDELGGQIVSSTTTIPYKMEHTHDIRTDTRGGCYWAEGALIGSTLPAEAVADTIPAAPWGSVSAEAGAE